MVLANVATSPTCTSSMPRLAMTNSFASACYWYTACVRPSLSTARRIPSPMPDFANASISQTSEDLAAYTTFVKKLKIGQVVVLPLSGDDTSRKVMRALNAAAGQNQLRLTRLAAPAGAVKFKVAPPEKRAVALSEEARRARTEKARATKAR